MTYTPAITETTLQTGTIMVQGLNIFFREAGKPGNPKLVFLHGFPASSHQYRNLLPALADTFHVPSTRLPKSSKPSSSRRDLPALACSCRTTVGRWVSASSRATRTGWSG